MERAPAGELYNPARPFVDDIEHMLTSVQARCLLLMSDNLPHQAEQNESMRDDWILLSHSI